MKKLMFVLCAAVCAGVLAAPAADKKDTAAKAPAKGAAEVRVEGEARWPVPLEFIGMEDIDVIGIRFTIPWHVKSENVTGFDLGFWGRCRYMEGFQINIFRNDVGDKMSGIQVGLYNSCGQADLWGIQIGLWNEAHSFRGIQAGLVNIAETGSGIQAGLINRCDSLYGFQGGAVNVIRESGMPFCPLLNIGFDIFTDPKF